MMDYTTPSVTIGLTCYNAADTILRALRSALAQDWPNIEVVVVDDKSSDDSAAIVEAAIINEPRVRLVQHTVNSGPAIARNTILVEAKGDLIVFFDDDDESDIERIRTQYHKIRVYENAASFRTEIT